MKRQAETGAKSTYKQACIVAIVFGDFKSFIFLPNGLL